MKPKNWILKTCTSGLVVGGALLAICATDSALAENPKTKPISPQPPKCNPQDSGSSSFYWYMTVGNTRYEAPDDALGNFRFSVSMGQQLGSLPPSMSDAMSVFYGNGTLNRLKMTLTIEKPSITASILDPSVISVIDSTQSEVLWEGDTIKQIVTDDLFTVIEEQSVGFRIKSYDLSRKSTTKTSGFYTLVGSGEPIYETIFTTDDGLAYSYNIEIISIDHSGTSTRVEYTSFTTNTAADTVTERSYLGTWNAGTSTTTKGIQVEEVIATYSARGSRPYDYTLVKETKRVNVTPAVSGSGITYGTSLVTVSKTLDQYVDMTIDSAGGDSRYKRLVKHIDGYGSNEPLETNYTWYNNTGNDHLHARIKTVIRPDKSWEYHEYNDGPFSATASETVYEGWKGQTYSPSILTSAKKTVTEILSSGYTKTESVGSQMISQEKKTFLAGTANGKILRTERKIGSEWLLEQTEYYPQDDIASRAGRPKYTLHTDGTYTVYSYSSPTGDLTITEKTGAGNSSSITSGTQTVKVYNEWNEQISEQVSDIATSLLLNSWVADTVDSVGRPTRITYNANPADYEEFEYICCGLGTRRKRDASAETFIYDHFKRPIVTTYYHYDGDTAPIISTTSYNGLTTSQEVGGLLMSLSTTKLNGEVASTRSADADGDGNAEETTYAYSYPSSGGKIETQTNPDGGTQIIEYYTDGQLKSVTGTAVAAMSYDYSTHNENGGGLTNTKSWSTTEWEKIYYDSLGRNTKTEYPASTNFENGDDLTKTYYAPSAAAGSRGKLETTIDPDGVTVTTTYDGEGRRATQTQPITSNLNKVTSYEYDVVNDSGTGGIGLSERIRTSISGTLVQAILQSGDGYRSKQTVIGRGTTVVVKTVSDASGNSTETTTNPDGTKSVRTVTANRQTSVASKASDDTVIASVSYTHDALDRVETAVDSRTGATTYSDYTNAGQAMKVTAPGSRVTEFVFDKLGRRLEMDAPDTSDSTGATLSNVSYRSYYPTGRVKAMWGDQRCATFHLYDDQNRMTELRTYQSLAHGTEPTNLTTGYAKTNWNYDENRGLLLSKKDNSNKGVTYKYTAAGRLKSRTWERGVMTTYGYTNGLLTTKDYSDDTLDVSIIYDAFGRYEAVKQHDPVTEVERSKFEYTYDASTLAVDTETISYDLNHDETFEFIRTLARNALDSAGREVGWELKSGATVENEVTYDYDTTEGRLESVNAGDLGSFTYAYQNNSANLIASVTGPAHTVTNIWDDQRDVLESKQNSVGTIAISEYTYTVNDIGQRTAVSTLGTAFTGTPSWEWGYNAKGEVVKTDSSVAANDRSYGYDGIGNRLKSANSLTLPATNNYTVNALNQYTAVGGLNSTYDDDGNATAYPVPYVMGANASLTWDAENRLYVAEGGVSSFPTVYNYDAYGRMIGHFNAIAGGWTYYVYDRWNRIAEYNNVGIVTRTYAWGLDLSGSTQGAGGVGGLLGVCHEDETGDPVFFSTYDGNGNVSEYLNASGAVQAHFEYDPFGNTVVNTDTTGEFRFRFSTKPQDSITGLCYYGYRWYDPVTGRWLGRDPIEEKGGVNLYGFLRNDGLNRLDAFGLKNQKQAAREATNKYNPQSIKEDKEYCGMICKHKETGDHIYTQAPGTIDSCNPQDAPCPDCYYSVAYWHTHGAFVDNDGDGIEDRGYDTEHFSDIDSDGDGIGDSGDIPYADNNDLDGYVGTPKGDFLHYDHNGGQIYDIGSVDTN